MIGDKLYHCYNMYALLTIRFYLWISINMLIFIDISSLLLLIAALALW